MSVRPAISREWRQRTGGSSPRTSPS
jgi:hypothetical protein